MKKWTLEDDVNDYIKRELESLGLKKHDDYNVESTMSDYMKESLRGSAKTQNKTNFGKPDFSIEKYSTPVIIESKLSVKKLLASTKEGYKMDDKSISGFAVNGALHYAQNMVASGKYTEVIAIGVAGDNAQNVDMQIHYVYGSSGKTFKKLGAIKTLNFLESKATFDDFYKNAILTSEEKHQILISSRQALQAEAKKLSELMQNLYITAPQRVLYVSGMLLAMQDVTDTDGKYLQDGLTPNDLRGSITETKRDGKLITNHIHEFIKARKIGELKQNLILASFGEISKDAQRDEPTAKHKHVDKFIKDTECSVNKQIFTFIYEKIFKAIDSFAGHLDIIGEMYSEFLKYALGDGKEIGIVLTPPYVTKMMAEILNIDLNSKVMDLATGSAGFLISAMELMISQAEAKYGKHTSKAKEEIERIKKSQLLGVELNAEMYTLAATNMILRGDGSSNIEKGSAFNRPEALYANFKANRILLNPPFTHEENGMPFIKFGLEKMEKGGLGAIIIQDSAGSGQAQASNKEILKKHTLLSSIKMPGDLFQPMAGVQTSIYVFEAHKPHDYEQTVKFIDFRNDGYKRTSRSLQEVDAPTERYQDIVKIYKAGLQAKVSAKWNLEEVYVEDFISDRGDDWNFEQHKKIDTTPKLEDFKKTVADYLAWEVAQILKKDSKENPSLGK